MIEEALSGTTPQVHNPADMQAKGKVTPERQSTAPKSTISTSNTAGSPKGKNERLISHLLIGFAMTVIAVAGYTFLGPRTDASAEELAANNIVNVATDVPGHTMGMSDTVDADPVHDLVAMQAEMDAITQQMNALQNGTMPINATASTTTSPVTNQPLVGHSGNDLEQAASTLDQMMLTIHQMIEQINSLNQQGGAGTPANGSGHGHH